jgi:hypothetical protein
MQNMSDRDKAWLAFEKAADNVQKGAYSLELVRHARVFSTAPPEEQEGWEIGIMAAGAQGNARGVKNFGKILYDWAKNHGYSALTIFSVSWFLASA